MDGGDRTASSAITETRVRVHGFEAGLGPQRNERHIALTVGSLEPIQAPCRVVTPGM
jgi:hypothetical protein